MAVITEEQRKANQEIINKLMKVLGIDDYEEIRDFSIHVRKDSAIETEVHFYNTKSQLEKVVKVFQSVKGNAIDTNGSAMDKMQPEPSRDLYSKWKTIEPGKVYNKVYIISDSDDFNSEGLVIQYCVGDIEICGGIEFLPLPLELNENDLVLNDLTGIKGIELVK